MKATFSGKRVCSRAIEMSIKIIDVFVKLREMLLTHKDILLKLEQFEKQAVQNSGDIQMILLRSKVTESFPRSLDSGSATADKAKKIDQVIQASRVRK